MTLPTKAGQLQEQIDTLRATVEQQQRQIDALLARVAALESKRPRLTITKIVKGNDQP